MLEVLLGHASNPIGAAAGKCKSNLLPASDELEQLVSCERCSCKFETKCYKRSLAKPYIFLPNNNLRANSGFGCQYPPAHALLQAQVSMGVVGQA